MFCLFIGSQFHEYFLFLKVGKCAGQPEIRMAGYMGYVACTCATQTSVRKSAQVDTVSQRSLFNKSWNWKSGEFYLLSSFFTFNCAFGKSGLIEFDLLREKNSQYVRSLLSSHSLHWWPIEPKPSLDYTGFMASSKNTFCLTNESPNNTFSDRHRMGYWIYHRVHAEQGPKTKFVLGTPSPNGMGFTLQLRQFSLSSRASSRLQVFRRCVT